MTVFTLSVSWLRNASNALVFFGRLFVFDALREFARAIIALAIYDWFGRILMATLSDRVVNFGMQALDELTVENHVEDGLAKALVKTNQNALVLALEESDRRFEESMRRMDKAFAESNRRFDEVNKNLSEYNERLVAVEHEVKYFRLKMAALLGTFFCLAVGVIVAFDKVLDLLQSMFS